MHKVVIMVKVLRGLIIDIEVFQKMQLIDGILILKRNLVQIPHLWRMETVQIPLLFVFYDIVELKVLLNEVGLQIFILFYQISKRLFGL